MDDETFAKHMDARHMPIGGLTRVLHVDKTLRAYHRHAHWTGREDRASRKVNHQHREAQ